MRMIPIKRYAHPLRQIITVTTVVLFFLNGCDNGTARQKAEPVKKKTARTVQKNAKQGKFPMAPDFTLADLDGDWVTLNELKGKVVLLNFWGTWCGPCRREIPAFINLTEKYKKDGLEILGITLTSGSPSNIRSFADKWGINYTLLTDIEGNETQTVTALYSQATGQRITGIPTTFIIDREGFIRQRYVGPRSEKIFYKDLEPYL